MSRGYYRKKEVAKILGVEPRTIERFVRAGFVSPARDEEGAVVFTFQDLIILRTAKALRQAKITPARIKRALARLSADLPQGRSLTSVRILAEGNRLVVQDEDKLYQPETGQLLLDFGVKDLARKIAPLAKRTAKEKKASEAHMSADDWYALGCELEIVSIEEARDAYRRAIELAPGHADAHTNLGRLLHEARVFDAAEAHYRLALQAEPSHATAWFNLGIVLEDAGRISEAVAAYERAVEHDTEHADAHWNAARLYHVLGRPILALRHVRSYEKLKRSSPRRDDDTTP